MAHALFMAVALSILTRSYRAVRAGSLLRVAVSTMAAVIYILCLWLPGILQANGQLQSKLHQAGVIGPPSATELSHLTLRWSLELTVVLLAESVVLLLARSNRLQLRAPRRGFEDFRAITYACLAIGAYAMITTEQAIDNRGEEGNGAQALMVSFFVSGLALLAYFLPAGAVHRVVLLAGIVALAGSYVRSPLIVVAIAFGLGALQRGSLRNRRSITALVIGAAIFVVAASRMSAVRANLIRGEPANVQAELWATVSKPLAAPYRHGIDTLDGYRFSRSGCGPAKMSGDFADQSRRSNRRGNAH